MTAVVYAQIRDLAAALAELPLPARHVRIDNQGRLAAQDRSGAVHDDYAIKLCNLVAKTGQFLGIEKSVDFQRRVEAEDRVVVAKVRGNEGVDLLGRFENLPRA